VLGFRQARLPREKTALEIADFLAPDRVITAIRVNDKAQLLAELARRAAGAIGIPALSIRAALEARERLGSTGVGGGIAIPHAQIPGLDRFYGLFVRLYRPIEYEAIDTRPVDLVFLLLIPANAKEHLRALASISRRLRDQTIASELRHAKDARAIYETLAATP